MKKIDKKNTRSLGAACCSSIYGGVISFFVWANIEQLFKLTN